MAGREVPTTCRIFPECLPRPDGHQRTKVARIQLKGPIPMRLSPKIPQPFSRRSFLRGVGVTMALPWLESLPVWGDDAPKDAASEPPVRFACLFAGNGFHSKEWWARGEGKD